MSNALDDVCHSGYTCLLHADPNLDTTLYLIIICCTIDYNLETNVTF